MTTRRPPELYPLTPNDERELEAMRKIALDVRPYCESERPLTDEAGVFRREYMGEFKPPGNPGSRMGEAAHMDRLYADEYVPNIRRKEDR